jgi:hypothetical protein
MHLPNFLRAFAEFLHAFVEFLHAFAFFFSKRVKASTIIPRGSISMRLTRVHSFSAVAYVWVRGTKTTGPIAKMFGFSYDLIFSAVRNFKFRHMFCRNKKFCSENHVFLYICRNTNFGQYWLSTHYFLGDFNETFRLLFFHAHLRMCQVSLKNIQK